MAALKLHKTAKSLKRKPLVRKNKGAIEKQPTDLNQLRNLLDPESQACLPVCPRGSGAATTGCNTAEGGTIMRMTNR